MTNDPRDHRASQILSAAIRVQAWFQMPDREWPLVSLFADDVVQTTIELQSEAGIRTALLVEFNSQLDVWDKWHPADQARLRKIAARLRFAWAGLPRIIAARLIEANGRPEDKIRMRICNPATFGAKLGSAITRATPEATSLFSNELPTCTYRGPSRSALHWYLAGIDATDPRLSKRSVNGQFSRLCLRSAKTFRSVRGAEKNCAVLHTGLCLKITTCSRASGRVCLRSPN